MKYIKITSISNPMIREAFDIKNRRSKYKHTAFLIEGPNLVEAAMTSGNRIMEVFLTRAFSEKEMSQRLLKKISENTSKIFEVEEHIINKLAGTETPRGIVAVASYRLLSLNDLPLKDNPFLVVIDAVQDPGNLGTIIRTADAAGVDAAILLPGTCDAFMPKAIRSTAGSIFNIPILYTETDMLLRWLHGENIQLIITSADAEKSIYDIDLKKPLAMVFGNEAHGASEKIRKSADLLSRIPIYGKAESLNVATAAAVCLYEAVRQRRLK
ncbi:MAG: RNA methyltransferase [Nitrospirota bacterium]